MPELIELPQWLGTTVLSDSTLDLGTLKTELSKRGVSSRGWRLYLDPGDAMFKPLSKNWLDKQTSPKQATAAIAWLCVLEACEMDVLPPLELVYSIDDWKLPGGQLDGIPPAFLRAAWKAAVLAEYDDIDIENFIQTGVIPLAQWFFQSGAYKSTGPDSGFQPELTLLRLRKRIQLQNHTQPKAPLVLRYEKAPEILQFVPPCQPGTTMSVSEIQLSALTRAYTSKESDIPDYIESVARQLGAR